MLSRLVCFLLFAIPVLAKQQQQKGSGELVEVSPDEAVKGKVEEETEEGLVKNETSDDGVDKANEGSQTEGSHREGWLEWLKKEKQGSEGGRVGKRDENEDLIPEDIDESDTLPITYSLIGVR